MPDASASMADQGAVAFYRELIGTADGALAP